MRRAVLLARPLQYPPHHNTRHLTSFHRNDRVLLRPTKRNRNTTYASPILTQPLHPSHHLDTPRGRIRHDEIIGKGVRDIVRTGATGGKKSRDGGGNGNGNASASGLEYRLHEVRLEEYVRFTRRLVTPLYPQDAQVIVGLMDLHPQPAQWGEDQGERLEVLEAGTGHGALTLYLSRAVHAANPALPRHLRFVREGEESEGQEEADHTAMEAWKSTRRAIVHSVEISPRYSAQAEKIVRGFRHGMYTHNVDFHVNSVTPFVQSRMDSLSDQPFLSHAFLDLPGTEQHLAAVSSALKTDGSLIVFCPSITQIMACLSTVKEDGLPLELEKVVELGVNGGTGGREWDVRAVRPRANQKADAGIETKASVVGEEEDSASGGGAESETREDSGVDVRKGEEKVEQGSKAAEPDDGGGGGGWKMVCRPKVGELVVGGGFLGVFRKQRRDVAE
ncbi:hypothetical protein B0A55_02618 [Friedmanniomyces simplex]|uniref:tRNA (adenine(58)-N(1))-methyltransferase catalytic subunit TRM61 n=1 Tax=Friedmanniomyces simplex TaxID=329884 RepID=A0A4U0XU10_9PEZI|nr:hypothetical protein B0A55_02618 [Friedmanniomyces simplex]